MWNGAGHDATPVSTRSEEGIESEEAALEALWALQDGGTLKLGVQQVKLNATLQIASSHVVITGAPGRTRVHCPSGSSAFAISGTNVTLYSLEFSHCWNASAVRIRGDPSETSVTDTGDSESGAKAEEKRERTVFVKDCLFQQNEAWNGAAIRASRCCLEIESTIFADNRAYRSGGALHVFRGKVAIENSTFSNCSAENGDGGAVLLLEVRELSLSQSLFRWNSATHWGNDGGGLAAERCRRMTVVNSTFLENRADQYGGGFNSYKSNSVTVKDSTFSKDHADYGGAFFIHYSRKATVRDSTFSENSAYFATGGFHASSCNDVTVEDSTFSGNSAGEDCGGVSVSDTDDVTIRGSKFSGNRAGTDGGGVCVEEVDNVTIRRSKFSGNRAGTVGGGVCVDKVDNVTITKSSLHRNSASNGGALITIASVLRIDHSDFADNEAKDNGGGILATGRGSLSLNGTTFVNNSGFSGGAISLVGDCLLEKCEKIVLHGNLAFRGGGLFCRACSVALHAGRPTARLRFVENAAVERGGGIYAEEAASVVISDAKFVRNIAGLGGGVAVKDSSFVLLQHNRFKENVAIEGGGLHVSSENGHFEKYEVWVTDLERNRALSLRQMSNPNGNPTISRWLKERNKTLSTGEKDRLRREEYFQGRGGGAFFSLRNHREDSSINVDLGRLTVQENSAIVGGGIYFDNQNVSSTGRDKCPQYGVVREPCLGLWVSESRLVDNAASVAGGGLFVRASSNLGTTLGILDSSGSLQDCTHTSNAFCYQNNHIVTDGGDGYGPQIATPASSLEFLNVNGTLIGFSAGDRLLVLKNSDEKNSIRKEEIQLILRDALGRRIRGKTVDSELTVVLRSKWISGQREYRALNGVITINETYLNGYDVSDEIIIETTDDTKLFATVAFSTLPCPNGELPNESKTDCFKCSANSYAFSATGEECQPCAEHAKCVGTAQLVPEDGYWHSTPFGPFIRRCPLKDACTFDGRIEGLVQFYNKSSEIYSKLDRFNSTRTPNSIDSSEEYQQCAEGYRGILCGACAQGYGHSSGGECKPCTGSVTAAGFLTGVSAVALFLVLTVKVALGADGVKKHLSSVYKEKRKEARLAARQLLKRWMSTTPSVTQPEGSHVTSVRLTVDQTAEPKNPNADSIAGGSEDQGTSIGCEERTPMLRRTTRKVEDPFENNPAKTDNASSVKLSIASEMLVATYNILFNFIQLSSFAFPVNVDWKAALKALFSLYGGLGRVMQIEFLPLDCSFSDREDDTGTPNSITVIWYRVCFPAMAAAAYTLIIWGIKLVRGKQRGSRDSVDAVPSLILVCLLVYLAYSIDIFSDLLRVVDCQDLSFEKGRHIYEAFEVKDLGVLWTEDTSVQCWEGAHGVSTVFAAFGLCACAGVLVFMVAVLIRGAKKNRLDDPAFVRRFGVLYVGYRTDGIALHWESVLTVRRMLLAALQVYGSHRETTGVQVGFMAIVIFASLAIHTVVLPFEEADTEDTFPLYAGSELGILLSNDLRKRWANFNQHAKLNGLEAASLFMSLSLFMVAGCICDDKANDVEANLLITACFFLNAIYFLFMLYRMWYGFHHYLDAMADEKNLKFTDAVDMERDRETWLHLKVLKLWRSRSESIDVEPSITQNA